MSNCYTTKVKLIGKNKIDEFKKIHSSSRKALDRWVKLIEGADLGTPQEIKGLFGVNVDFVGNQAVFDVGGNKVRAITKIEYGNKIVLITHVLTHIEYDKEKWKE
jgi:mRNA interferase HigB